MGTRTVSTQQILGIIALVVIAYPWTCIRHCALGMSVTQARASYVCHMQSSVAPSTNTWNEHTSATPFPAPPVIQFVVTTLAGVSTSYHSQSVAEYSLFWQNWYASPVLPPPKHAV